MRLLLLVFVLQSSLSAQSLPRGNPEQHGFSSQRLEQLTRALQQYSDDRRLAGGVVLIARDGHIIHLDSFGMRDVEAKAPMQTDAIFRIASQTKALVSVATMMLMEDGALLLSDPVSKYIPDFAKTKVAVRKEGGGYDVVDAKRQITIRDLMTHTAGISYGSGIARDQWAAANIQGWYLVDRNEPMSAIITRMAALPFESQPGEKFVYGYATDVLGVIVERITGMSLDAFLLQRITTPLRMKDTHFFVPPAKRSRLATVYLDADSGRIRRAPDTTGVMSQSAHADGPRKAHSGGAGMVSTAGDYARFLQMLLNGGALDSVRILSPKTVQLMTTKHVDYFPPARGFGLGFQTLEDVGALGHPGTIGEFGWGGAYHSTYWVDPREKLVVVYFTQQVPATGRDDFLKLRALVYGAMTHSRN